MRFSICLIKTIPFYLHFILKPVFWIVQFIYDAINFLIPPILYRNKLGNAFRKTLISRFIHEVKMFIYFGFKELLEKLYADWPKTYYTIEWGQANAKKYNKMSPLKRYYINRDRAEAIAKTGVDPWNACLSHELPEIYKKSTYRYRMEVGIKPYTPGDPPDYKFHNRMMQDEPGEVVPHMSELPNYWEVSD